MVIRSAGWRPRTAGLLHLLGQKLKMTKNLSSHLTKLVVEGLSRIVDHPVRLINRSMSMPIVKGKASDEPCEHASTVNL